MKKRTTIAAATLLLGFGATAFAQQGQINVQQDTLIPQLLELKTDLGSANKIGDRYRIQIFSGDNSQASTVIKEFRSKYPGWPSTIVYETPNYKVWVGNFRNSLEADRALKEVKATFPTAFRFRPDRS